MELIKITRNALSQLTIRFSGSFATFLITLLITEQLGLVSLGTFIKITSFVSIFYLLVDFGINTVYLRDNFDTVEEKFNHLITLRLLLSTLVFVVVLIITYFLPSGNTTGFSQFDKLGIVIYSLTFFTEGLLVSFTGLLQKRLQQHALIVPSLVSSILIVVLVLLGIQQKNMLFILFAYPIAEAVQIIATLLFIKKKMMISVIESGFKAFSKKTLVSAAPLALMLFLNVVYFRVDTFILSLYSSTADVGAYGFSYKIFEFLIAFPTFLTASMFPILIQHKNNAAEFSKKIRHYSLLLLVSSIVMSCMVFAFAPLLVLFGGDVSPAILPLQILSLSLPFFFLTSLFQWVLLLKHKVYLLVVLYATTMIINIILNVLYVPVFSYTASAVITVVSEVLVLLAMTIVLSLTKSEKY